MIMYKDVWIQQHVTITQMPSKMITLVLMQSWLDCNGNCLVGTLTSISVRVAWGSTYSLLQYGGSWDLVDLSTGSSMVAATSDDESLCLPDGCYEISELRF